MDPSQSHQAWSSFMTGRKYGINCVGPHSGKMVSKQRLSGGKDILNENQRTSQDTANVSHCHDIWKIFFTHESHHFLAFWLRSSVVWGLPRWR